VLAWSRTPADSGKYREQIPPRCGSVLFAQFRAQLHHDVDSPKVLLRPPKDFTDQPFTAISIYRPGKRSPAGNQPQPRMGKVVVSDTHHE